MNVIKHKLNPKNTWILLCGLLKLNNNIKYNVKGLVIEMTHSHAQNAWDLWKKEFELQHIIIIYKNKY